jgi:hypothetical protein
MLTMGKYITEPRNVLPNGLTLLQVNPDLAADLVAESKTFGWLFYRGWEPEQWVTLRKLLPRELEDAYDQSADMRVLDAGAV